MARSLPSTKAKIPKAGEVKRGKEGYLAYLLRQANAATRLALDRALANLDVTLPQFSVLVIVNAYQPLSNADLARLSLLTPQTINVIVKNLEERGAIRRQAHPVHKRVLNLQMTGEGGRLLKQCRTRADRIEAHLRAGLGNAEEEEVVRRWLSYIASSLGVNREVD